MGRKGDHFARRKEGRFIGRDNEGIIAALKGSATSGSRAERADDIGRTWSSRFGMQLTGGCSVGRWVECLRRG